jgi:hypothetical protein
MRSRENSCWKVHAKMLSASTMIYLGMPIVVKKVASAALATVSELIVVCKNALMAKDVMPSIRVSILVVPSLSVMSPGDQMSRKTVSNGASQARVCNSSAAS